MQSLYPNVPNYGEVPRGASDAQMLASLEGRQAQTPTLSPQVAPKVGEAQQPTYAPQQQPVYSQPKQPSTSDTLRQIGADTATNYVAQQGASMLGGGGAGAATGVATATPVATATESALGIGAAAPEAGLMYDAAGNAIGTAAGESLGSGSGLLGANGATLGGAGVGLAGGAVGAYYLNRGMHAYGHIKDPDKEKQKQGWAEAALLSNPMTAWLEPVAGPVFDLFDSGKPKEQQHRDTVRTGLKKIGILNDNYEFEMPDGTRYYTGNDGSTPQYQIQNADKPLTGRVVGAAQVIAGLMLGEPGKSAEDLTGELTNMALSNATTYEQAMGNLMFQFEKFVQASGLTPQAARDEINSWVKEGKIDQQVADAYLVAHESFLEGNPWQFTNEQAIAPLEEGQAQQGAPTYIFDPASNIRPSDGTPFPTITPAQPQQPAQQPATQPTTQQQAPKILETQTGTMNSIPIGGKPGIVTQPAMMPVFGGKFPYIRNIQAMLNRGR